MADLVAQHHPPIIRISVNSAHRLRQGGDRSCGRANQFDQPATAGPGPSTSGVLPGASRASLPRMVYRVGDVPRISCSFTRAVVTGVDEAYVSVRWPWWEVDPDVEGVCWNGEVALGRADPDDLYMTEPCSLRLAPR